MKSYQGRKLSKRRRVLLTAAVLAWLAALPSVAAATDPIPVEELDYGGKKFATLVFFPEGVGLGKQDDWYVNPSQYTLDEALRNAAVSGARYWAGILGDGAKNETPWQINVNTDNRQNASAGSYCYHSDGTRVDLLRAGNFIPAQFRNEMHIGVILQTDLDNNHNVPPVGDYAFSEVSIGRYFGANRDGAIDGWWVDKDTVLPTNEQAADFVGTLRHELGHALGISLKTGSKKIQTQTYDTIHPNSTENSWNMHLMDQNGRMAVPGMIITTSDKIPAGLTEADCFIVDKDKTADGKGYAYFVGENVTNALDGAKFFGWSALPVDGWGSRSFDGSHLQTAGMMSHRDYSNYTTFLEVELAVMQDLGYQIDRRAYFGKSIYKSGATITNTQGFFARNAGGTAYLENTYSTVPLGIGLHVYGANNTVTQAANILTKGDGATGVRVDGMNNTLNVPAGTEIHADGLRGNGVLIAYGSGQTVNQAGTVTASGQGGTGIRFDFGSSTNGADDEYRGSYIRYKRGVQGIDDTHSEGHDDLGKITEGENLSLTIDSVNLYNAAPDELNGAMVENYNLSGTLAGGGNAIYIGKNAFVKNINVNAGASIRGNITSDWKQFGTRECEGAYDVNQPLKIQYNGSSYAYSAYIPDLVTQLNFNADIAYSGDIIGEDNMKINVNAGTLQYSGAANVLSVNVAQGATLRGGTFTLNDVKARMPAAFSDNTTGWFINHGTIGPLTRDDRLTINGSLLSDGTLLGIAGGAKGDILVNGAAKVDGSKVAVLGLLPGEQFTVLTATGGVTGKTQTAADTSLPGSVSGTSSVSGTTVSLSASGSSPDDDTPVPEPEPYVPVPEKDSKEQKADGSGTKKPAAKPAETKPAKKPAETKPAAGKEETTKSETGVKLGLLNEQTSVAGDSLVITANAANNLGTLTERQTETYDAMMAIANHGDAAVRDQLRPLYSLTPEGTKAALDAVSAPAAAKSTALAQQSTLVSHLVSVHLAEAFASRPVTLRLPAEHLDDTRDKGPTVSMNLAQPVDNDFWFKAGENWGRVQSDTNYHGTALALGWDRAYGKTWRAGAFVSYGMSSFADNSAMSKLRDTRVGFYAGHRGTKSDFMFYVDGGTMRTHLQRSLTGLGLGTDARYRSHIFEIGGEYRYDLQGGTDKIWHTSPYVNAQYSRLWQNGYSETGAGIYNHHVGSLSSNYFAAGLGVEFRRYLPNGSYGLRVGVKHAFAGADPKLSFRYEGYDGQTYDMASRQDKTHVVLSLSGEAEFAPGWTLTGEAGLQRGAHDSETMCFLTLRRMW